MSSNGEKKDTDATDVIIKADRIVDARGFMSPLPLLRARAALRRMKPGQILKLLTTDKRTKTELHIWGFNMGYKIIKTREKNGVLEIYVKKEGT